MLNYVVRCFACNICHTVILLLICSILLKCEDFISLFIYVCLICLFITGYVQYLHMTVYSGISVLFKDRCFEFIIYRSVIAFVNFNVVSVNTTSSVFVRIIYRIHQRSLSLELGRTFQFPKITILNTDQCTHFLNHIYMI